MRKLLIFLSVCLLAVAGYGQGENNNWYFGRNAGITFNACNTTPLLNGKLNTTEGVATASDEIGDLLFYTDGVTIWNKNHQVMDNGYGLMGHFSSTSSALIIRKPYSQNLYYVVTIDAQPGNIINGHRYSIIDLTGNNGLGSVIQKNILLRSNVTERQIWINHTSDSMIWLIGHDYGSNAFYAFLINSQGINLNPIISNVGIAHVLKPGGNYSDAIGVMKASPSGSKIAVAISGEETTQLFDFNRTSGVVLNPISLPFPVNAGCYGVEFSPDETKLYVSARNPDHLNQFELIYSDSLQINASKLSISPKQGMALKTAALQLGPDNNIYVAINLSDSLAVILNPNAKGSNCAFIENYVPLLPSKSAGGLPSPIGLIQPIQSSTATGCENEPVTFRALLPPNTTVTSWHFGDSLSSANSSTLAVPSHSYTKAGSYRVQLVYEYAGSRDTLIRLYVIKQKPVFTIQAPDSFCHAKTLTIVDSASCNYQYRWSTGDTTQTIEISTAGTYWVEVTDPKGCTSRATVQVPDCINSLLIPNTITPNSDHINDFFAIRNEAQHSLHLQLFNRWGKLIFEDNNYRNSWSAESQPDGLYYYLLQDQSDGNNYKGWVEVVR